MDHPIVASAAETGDLRAGSAHTAEDALNVIPDLVDRAETALCQIAMVPLDAGFPDDTLLSDLKARGTPDVARLSTITGLDHMAAPHLKRPLLHGRRRRGTMWIDHHGNELGRRLSGGSGQRPTGTIVPTPLVQQVRMHPP